MAHRATSRARPSRAIAQQAALKSLAATNGLPVGRVAEQVRRAYRRGTLAPEVIDAARLAGADDTWFAPRSAALAGNLASVVLYFTLKGEMPREGDVIHLTPGAMAIASETAGRWMTELRTAARRNGRDSDEECLLDAIETLAAAIDRQRVRR